ncbi:Sperm associated antigen 1 [Blyttiomyces sp. JEL0837]|nr:Sperm associated antigen 1 [Blyttiomyces sp. JEL0837]
MTVENLTSKDFKNFVDGFVNPSTNGPAHSPAAKYKGYTPTEYDAAHLDYSWVGTATDLQELCGLLNILKSGKEGIYPQLEDAFQKRIEELDPAMKLPEPSKPISYDELKSITSELSDWRGTMRKTDAELRKTKHSRQVQSSAPVRGLIPDDDDETGHELDLEDDRTLSEEAEADIFASEDSLKSRTELELLKIREEEAGSVDRDNAAAASAEKIHGILKAKARPVSTSPDSGDQKKHVRFKDQIEAAEKALEKRKQKEQRRQHILEVQQEKMAAAKKKKNKSKHSKSHSHGSKSPSPDDSSAENSGQELSGSEETLAEVVEQLESEVEEHQLTITELEDEVVVSTKQKETVTVDKVEPIDNDVKSKEATAASAAIAAENRRIEEKKRIKSTDYRSWDRFNVDEELERLEKEAEAKKTESEVDKTPKRPITAPTKINADPNARMPVPDVKPESISSAEVVYLADLEKTKGNEAFKSQDFEDAIDYYTRSLKILPRANLYTNRAIAYLKVKQFQKAEDDCTAALELNDPQFNFKAYLRRASARTKRGKYLEAITDLNEALKLNPGNAEALKLLKETKKTYEDVEGERAKKLQETSTAAPKKRMVIEEVDNVEMEIETPMAQKLRKEQEVQSAAMESEGRLMNGVRSLSETIPPEVYRKMKGKERAPPGFMQESYDEEGEGEEEREPEMLRMWRERIEKEMRSRPGYACSSGTTRDDVVVVVNKKDEQGSEKDHVAVAPEPVKNVSEEKPSKEPRLELKYAESNLVVPPSVSDKVSKVESQESEKELETHDSEKESSLEPQEKIEEQEVSEEPASVNTFEVAEVSQAQVCYIEKVIESEEEVESATAAPAVVTEPPKTKIEPEVKAAKVKEYRVPEVSHEFEGVWKVLRPDFAQWSNYVSKIPPKQLPQLMAHVGSSNVLPDVFKAMKSLSEGKAQLVLEFMEELQKTPRMGLLVGFMSRSDKQVLNETFQTLSTNLSDGDHTTKRISALRRFYL